jgi:hypothetical protein
MPMVEIDETQLLGMRGLTEQVSKMLAHPEARKLVLKARKTVDPNASIPEIDASEPVNAELAKINERLEAMAKSQAEERAAAKAEAETAKFTQQWDAKKSALKRQGYMDEAIEGIEKLATERGIADLDAAAAYYDKLNPPATVVHPNGQRGVDFFASRDVVPEDGDKHIKALMDSRGESISAENAMIASALNQVRGRAA